MAEQPQFGSPEWGEQITDAISRVGRAFNEAASAFAALAQAIREGDARDVTEHPDLAYLDLQLEGFYGDPSQRDQSWPTRS